MIDETNAALATPPVPSEDTRRAVMVAIEQAVKSCAEQASKKLPPEVWCVDYAKILVSATRQATTGEGGEDG